MATSSGNLPIFTKEGDTLKLISNPSKASRTTHNIEGLQTADTETEHKTGGEFQGRGSQSSEDAYQLQGKDAILTLHFFEEKLIKMASDCKCQTVRLPAVGTPDLITIECQNSSKKMKLKGLFDDLKSEIQSVLSQEVQFSKDQREKVQNFIVENKSKDVFLNFDPNNKSAVIIYSKNSEKMRKACHKLKVELGQIKTTERRGRELVSESDSTMSDTGHFSSSGFDSSSGGMNLNLSSPKVRSDTDFEFRLGGNLLVKVYKGSITRVKVDAIVNAANESLHHAGGVARVIEDAAGKELTDESRNHTRKYGDLKVGGVCLTTAGRMQYRSVIHAVGPQWHMYSDKSKCLRDLYATICAVLLIADKEEYEKIAMPAISAGIFGVPKELCTDMYVRAAVKYSKDRETHQTFLREFHIVDLDTEILQDIRASWEKWQKDPQAIDPERVADEYAKKHGSFYQSHGQGRGHRGHRQWASSVSAMESTNYDVTSMSESHSRVTVVNMGKEDSFGRITQKFQLGQELVIKLYRASLVNTLQLDALVISISSKGDKGYLGKQVEEVGGREYQKSFDDEKRNKFYFNPGDILKCNSGSINVGCIIHVAIDRLQSTVGTELEKYRRVIKTFLKNVDDLKDIKTMVMPLLGSGNLKVPSDDLDRCSTVFAQVLSDFCFDRPKSSIKEIHIVNNDDNVCTSVEKAFHEMSVGSSSELSRGIGGVERSNMSSSRKGTENMSKSGRYDDAFNARSSSDNLSNSCGNPGGHATETAETFDSFIKSRAKVHSLASGDENIGSNTNKDGDQDEEISNDEDSDDGKSKRDTNTNEHKPPDAKKGNIIIVNM